MFRPADKKKKCKFVFSRDSEKEIERKYGYNNRFVEIRCYRTKFQEISKVDFKC